MTTYIEIHALQTLPPSNINRDDTGAPKSATYGGVRRVRVSSQAWKSAMRQHFIQTVPESLLGIRTKALGRLVREAILKQRDDLAEQADDLAVAVLTQAGYKFEKGKGMGETASLAFLSRGQVDAFAALAIEAHDSGDAAVYIKKQAKEVKAAAKGSSSLDIALFGRMVANGRDISVDAACQVAHALSVDAAESEFDYYTAMDDIKRSDDESGAEMIGTVEFASSTLYRYANVSWDELVKNLGSRDLALEMLPLFIEAFLRSMPTGKQNSFAARTLPEAMVVVIRDTQPVSFARAFHTPVSGGTSTVLEAAATAMSKEAQEIAALYGDEPTACFVARLNDEADALDALGERVTLPDLGEKVTRHLSGGQE